MVIGTFFLLLQQFVAISLHRWLHSSSFVDTIFNFHKMFMDFGGFYAFSMKTTDLSSLIPIQARIDLLNVIDRQQFTHFPD